MIASERAIRSTGNTAIVITSAYSRKLLLLLLVMFTNSRSGAALTNPTGQPLFVFYSLFGAPPFSIVYLVHKIMTG